MDSHGTICSMYRKTIAAHQQPVKDMKPPKLFAKVFEGQEHVSLSSRTV